MKTSPLNENPKGGPEGAERAVPANPGGNFLSKFSPGVRKLLASTPEPEWPRIRAFLIESEEEGELLDLVPGVNRVMKYCPPMLMGRVGKREIDPDELDRAYSLFHESIHGVRHAVLALLDLAGSRDRRASPEPPPPAPGAPRPKPPAADPPSPPPGARTSTAP